ncbi:18742_t:CDS:2 [Funneliformis geosporum]|uniref:5582_t:CDS:1 n=1 Tax=Funneliformis geosporum TaxID=1117311 RepID=A0A9W4SJL7_9GLOM|nr:18742_t:CDS:2 [Funneliformis geosporum]CAI2171900.1 5582_t:CDS:2 [Funneliformis geosporum]
MASAASQLQQKVLSFWFKDFKNGQILPPSFLQFWFSGGAVDIECRKHFSKELEDIFEKRSYVDELKKTPEGTLSLTILLDQFPRNIFRGTARPFVDFDPLALEIAKYCLHLKWDEKLEPIQKVFIYLPLEHSEKMEDQDLSLQKYKCLADTAPEVHSETLKSFLDYAESHRNIIKQFGRFPHRNKFLGRIPKKEEIDFLEQCGETFDP